MRVPCIGIDRVAKADMPRIRTELRRMQFSAWMLDDMVVAISGQVDVVRRIAQNNSTLAPRVRKLVIDGEELMQARDQTPGQYSDRDIDDPLKPRIARVCGLDRPHRKRLIGELNRVNFDAAYSQENGAVLIEYCLARKRELDTLLAAILADSEFAMTSTKAPKGPVIRYEGSLS